MPKAVIGPGTGLGMASLVYDERGKSIPIPGEGGHMSFSPQTERQEIVWKHLRKSYNYLKR